MRKSFELPCKSIDQKDNLFKLEIQDSGENSNEFIIKVRTLDAKPEEECFDMLCTDHSEFIKTETTTNFGGKKYSQKGIPEALIIKMEELYKKDIKSSSNKRTTGPDSLNPFAEKYWKRLIKLMPNQVNYFDKEGRYLYKYINRGS